MEGGDSVLQFLGWSVPRRVDSFYTGLSPGVHGVGLGGRRLGWGGSGEGSCAPAASFDGQDKKKPQPHGPTRPLFVVASIMQCHPRIAIMAGSWLAVSGVWGHECGVDGDVTPAPPSEI